MRFHLRGYIKLSRPLGGEEEELLRELLTSKGADVLRKGVPPGREGSKVRSWAIEGDLLKLEIEGTRYLRPHDALLRLKNLLSRELGRKLRVGVRGLHVDEYRIETGLEVDEDLSGLIGGLAEVESTRPLVVVFREMEEAEIYSRAVDRLIRELESLVSKRREVREGLVPLGTVLIRGREKPFATINGEPIDPSQEGERRGWFKRFPGRGQWILTPPAARLLRVIKEMICLLYTSPSPRDRG